VSKVVTKSRHAQIPPHLFIWTKGVSQELPSLVFEPPAKPKRNMCGPERVSKPTVLGSRKHEMNQTKLANASKPLEFAGSQDFYDSALDASEFHEPVNGILDSFH
jgi:hypothetical protein